MSDEIFFDGMHYVSAREAAESSGFTRDYVGRLCRDGKVCGKRIGKLWYVDKNSFQAFLTTQEYSKSKSRQTLSEQRRNEYHRALASFQDERRTSLTMVEPMISKSQNTLNEKDIFRYSYWPQNPAIQTNPPEHPSFVRQNSSKRAISTPDTTQFLSKSWDDLSSVRSIRDQLELVVRKQDEGKRTGHIRQIGNSYKPTYLSSSFAVFTQKAFALSIAVMIASSLYSVIDPRYALGGKEALKETFVQIQDADPGRLVAAVESASGLAWAHTAGVRGSVYISIKPYAGPVRPPEPENYENPAGHR
ncbi:helix-turn-helix domain-containing protein [Candidatus Kaiserbacteria bacterium]|nr:helix-turn-helix domain-containing protein [Candidatus Kaiserbacteria bacterium]